MDSTRKLLIRALKRRLPSSVVFLEAGNGEEALQIINSKGTAAIDLILLDATMPTMDGFECTARIRKLDAAADGIVIIGCTGNAMLEDQQMMVEAGADAVMIKPIDMGALHARILQDFSVTPQQGQG